jgi:signal transduction histidine kinase
LIIIFFVFSSINRAYIKDKVETLVEDQLKATSDLLKANIPRLLEHGYSPDDILRTYSEEENIYYLALLDEGRNVLGWSSRFDGYLPLSVREVERRDSWIISSPAGLIFNLISSFAKEENTTYYLYLGYSLASMEDMIAHSRRNFYLMFALMCGVGVLFFVGLYQVQVRFWHKEKELGEQKQEKDRYREISAFTSGMAHEIKNPLNSLALMCDLMHKKVPPELQKEAALGKQEIRKIARLVEQFSASLKPLELKREYVEWNELTESVTASLRQEFAEELDRVKFVFEEAVRFYADKNLVSQVLFNLVKNALEAAGEGGVFVRAQKMKKGARIWIQDQGPGLSEEEAKRVFDPFYTTKSQGMGIGLYLSRKVIEAHGGSLTLQTGAEKGAVFSIELPGEKYA